MTVSTSLHWAETSATCRALVVLFQELRELGALRFALLLRAVAHLPFLWLSTITEAGDPGLRAYIAKLAAFSALARELETALGPERGRELALRATRRAAVVVQRASYQDVDSLETLVGRHQQLRSTGLFRHMVYEGIEDGPLAYDYKVTRCKFFEAFTALGVPWLTEAFCSSDEIVFNELVPGVRFARAPAERNTIVRGASECEFHFRSAEPRPADAHGDC